MLGWVFRSSAVYCGCAVLGEEALWKAGQVNHPSGGVWRRIIREHWGQHLDKTCGSTLPFCMIFLPKGYHMSSAPFTSYGKTRAVAKPSATQASQADSQWVPRSLMTGLSK